LSHCSPASITPSPQEAVSQLVRQPSAAVSELAAPLSQASPLSWMPSPQVAVVLEVREASASE
jgi:hypothetical protein